MSSAATGMSRAPLLARAPFTDPDQPTGGVDVFVAQAQRLPDPHTGAGQHADQQPIASVLTDTQHQDYLHWWQVTRYAPRRLQFDRAVA
ncbi:hypothetical protein ABIB25_000637 [Nakamurella sp. UYEF19]